MNSKLFGVKVKKLRQANHLTQTQLALNLSVTLRTIQYWEMSNKIPKHKATLNKIANFFGVTTDYLIDDTCGVPDYKILCHQVYQVITDAQKALDNPKIPWQDKEYMMINILKYYVQEKEDNLK